MTTERPQYEGIRPHTREHELATAVAAMSLVATSLVGGSVILGAEQDRTPIELALVPPVVAVTQESTRIAKPKPNKLPQ